MSSSDKQRSNQPAKTVLHGGRFVRLHEIYDLPEQVLPQTEERTRNRDEEELWDNKWMFMILCVVLILEWLGRKLCRLL